MRLAVGEKLPPSVASPTLAAPASDSAPMTHHGMGMPHDAMDRD